MQMLHESSDKYLTPTTQINPKRAVKQKLVYTGRLFVRFLREGDHMKKDKTGINENHGEFPPDLNRFEQFIATVTSGGNLQLEPCYFEENRRATEPRGDSEKHLAYRILKCKRVNSQTFSLDVLNTRTIGNTAVQKLLCHAPHVDKANRWVQTIKRLVGACNEVTLPLDAPSFCFPIYLFVSNKISSFDDDEEGSVSSTSDTFSVKPYRLFLSQHKIHLQETHEKVPPIVVRIEDVQLKRHDMHCTTAPNTFVLYTKHKDYTCIMADKLQYLIATSLVELWIRSLKLNTADNHPEDSNSGKLIKGCLMIGSNLRKLSETQICIRQGTRWLECSDLYGLVEKFDVLYSEIVSDEASHMHLCRILARQLEPDYKTNQLRHLYIKVPTKEALNKWHKHFSLSPSTVLAVLNVILSELESRRHLPRSGTCMDSGGTGDECQQDWELDMEQSVQLFALPRNKIRSLLGIRRVWPNGRLERLLTYLLQSLAYPVIRMERQQDMVKLMLHKSENHRVVQRLPLLMAELLLEMTMFNLCILNRLTLYMSKCIHRVYPDLSQSTPLERLCLFRQHWLPLITALSHRKVEPGTSDEQDPWISAISYFIAAYQYLFHAIMS